MMKPSCPKYPGYCLCTECTTYLRAVWDAEEGIPRRRNPQRPKGQTNRYHELLIGLSHGEWTVPRFVVFGQYNTWVPKYLPNLCLKGWAEWRYRAGTNHNKEYRITDEGRAELERSKVSA